MRIGLTPYIAPDYGHTCVRTLHYTYAVAMGAIHKNGAGRGLRGTFAHGSMLDVLLVA